MKTCEGERGREMRKKIREYNKEKGEGKEQKRKKERAKPWGGNYVC